MFLPLSSPLHLVLLSLHSSLPPLLSSFLSSFWFSQSISINHQAGFLALPPLGQPLPCGFAWHWAWGLPGFCSSFHSPRPLSPILTNKCLSVQGRKDLVGSVFINLSAIEGPGPTSHSWRGEEKKGDRFSVLKAFSRRVVGKIQFTERDLDPQICYL